MGRSGAAVLTGGVFVVTAVLGAGIALSGALVHRHAWRLSEVTIPWGLLLGLATAYAAIRALLTVAGVAGAAGCAAGWAAMALMVQGSRPEGDYLVAGDTFGFGFVLGGLVVVVAAVVRSVGRSSDDRMPR